MKEASQQDKRRKAIISFSGIDGSGKSTQIAALCARLNDAGLSVRLITFWDDVAALTHLREATGHTLFKGDKGIGTPETPINRRDKNLQAWPMTVLRLGLYFLDALSLRAVVRTVLRSSADVVICDRYIYDELANLKLGQPVAQFYARLIIKLVPKPDLSLLLDADPVAARARKPEYPLDFLWINRASYLTLCKLSGEITIIAPMPLEGMTREVLKHAYRVLALEDTQGQSAVHFVAT